MRAYLYIFFIGVIICYSFFLGVKAWEIVDCRHVRKEKVRSIDWAWMGLCIFAVVMWVGLLTVLFFRVPA